MLVPFDSLPSTSKIWVFQSNREFTVTEEEFIREALTRFTEEWAAHGHPLRSSFEIRHGYFIILGADEGLHATSGCSVDASVRVFKDIQARLGVNLFDRNLVTFKSGAAIWQVPLAALKEKFAAGTLNESTETFNNLVATKSELEESWIMPAGKTWLKRYLPIEKVAP